MSAAHVSRPGRVRAVAVAGSPGSGKTTFGTALARATGFALLDLDDVAGALTTAALALAGVGVDALDDARHGPALRHGRYASLVATAVANLSVGLGVVLVAPFSDELRDRVAWSALTSRLAARTALCYVDVPDELLLARLARRGAPRDAAKLAAPDVFAATRAAVRPAVDHVRVDGTRPVEDEVVRVRRVLGLARDERGAWPGGPVVVPC